MNANNSDAFDSIADLLHNDSIPDDEALSRGKALLKMHPNAVQEADQWGLTLLHATVRRGPEFCKLLVEMSPDLARTANNFGLLPVHKSCQDRNFETTKYLLYLYPESINIADSDGYCPLHWFLNRSMMDRDT